jgi:hypothetical protein
VNSIPNQSYLDIHQQALSEVDEAYHNFLLLYSPSSKCVYGFCEGKDDPTFYHTLVLGKIPSDWYVKIIPAGGKDKVLNTFRAFDWNRFCKERICFFVDRDLDNYLGKQPLTEENIYTTDGYSIENSIFDSQLLLNVLSDVYQVTLLSSTEEDKILTLISENLKTFTSAMIPIMAQILLWKRSNVRPNLKNFSLDGLFEFQNRSLIPNSRNTLLLSASRHSGVQLSSEDELISAEKEIIGCPDLAMAIRGKYIAWFMVKQCEDLWANVTEILVRFVSKPKKRVEFGHKNANVIYAPRARIPDSLSCFLGSTYRSFINSQKDLRPNSG